MRAPADSLSELAERLVDTGIPWKTPGADVRHPLGDRLLVDVDPVTVSRGERAGVAGGLREPDQQQRDGRDDDRPLVADEVEVGQLRGRQAARHVADERDAVRAEVEQRTRRAARRRPAPARRGPRAPGSAARGSRRARPRRRAASSSGCRRASPATTRARATRCRRRPTSRSAWAARRSRRRPRRPPGIP